VAGKGPEADNLRQQAQNLGVADRVNLIGFVSDEERNHLFKVADCSVFPSLYEPFGIVALEAMALGSPLVVSDVGGFSEVVKHAETGIKIYPDNVESTAWGIVQALSNPDWSRQHTVRAYQSLELLFNWPRIARLTKAVYERIVADRSAS
jgi:glycosyltransferase involved in cell wall biosynthesis